MARPRHESRQQRLARFEQFEQRLVMSAQAVASILPELEIAAPALTQQVVTHPLLNNVSETTQAAAVAKQYGFDGAGQTVAVIDSGIAWDHYALGGGFGAGNKVVGGWDFAENDANPYDDGPAGFHGTHVAGIIGSTDEQYRGVSSGVDLVALRVFDDQGNGDLAWVEQALQWVHKHQNDFANPITTVNLSLGTDWNGFTVPEWATLEDEFAALEADGLFISVAAGNSFTSFNKAGLSYPAVSEHVVPVASHDGNGNLSDFSQRANNVLVAPGESIRSTVPGHFWGGGVSSKFIGSTGTSMAAPYVAGASAILRQANEAMGRSGIDQDLLYQQFRETADKIYDSVTKGYYYQINLEAALASVMNGPRGGSSSPGGQAGAGVAATELGSVVSQTVGNQTINGEAIYKMQASRDGILTLQTSGGQNSPLAIEIYDSQMNKIGSQTGNSSNLRLDFAAKQGETYYLKAIGIASGVELRLDNLVSLQSGTLTINGTNRNDSINVDTSNGFAVNVNGVSYQFAQSRVQSVLVNGHGGHDNFNLKLGSQNDAVVTTTNAVYQQNNQFKLAATSFETTTVSAGTGFDTITMLDSAGNDHFIANENSARLAGAGYSNTANGFDRVIAKSTGGVDSAVITGTAGNDFLSSYNGRNSLRVAGGTELVADQFTAVTINGEGGNDRANVFGTAGNDQFTVRPTYVTVTSGANRIWASSFENINALGGRGVDSIAMFDSIGDDNFIFNNGVATISSAGYLNNAFNFTQLNVTATTGRDVAQLFDTTGNDTFTSSGNSTTLVAANLSLTTNGFDRVNAIANKGGYDQAVIAGSSGADSLQADANSVTLTDRDQNIRRAVGFEKANVDLGAGADSVWLNGSSQREKLTASHSDTVFETTLQLLQIKNAEQTNFDGNGGGDEVIFDGFGELDLLESLGSQAKAYLRDHTVTADEFASLEARSVENAIAEYDLEAVDYLYMLRGKWKAK